ncbi:glycosyltransferase family 2 protein [Nakamurella sp. GG22]
MSVALPTRPPAEPVQPPRRQWGADKRTEPLPPVAPQASDARMAMGRIAIVFTVLAWLAYVFSYFFTGIINNSYQGNPRFLWETITYVAITSFLALSSLLYLVARQGALYRTRAHRRVPRAVIDDSFDKHQPTMTVLVPSYREEIAVVRMTLLSAALQEYPQMRVVLLLDDPPNPTAASHKASLEGARQLPADLMEWLRVPRERFNASLDTFETWCEIEADLDEERADDAFLDDGLHGGDADGEPKPETSVDQVLELARQYRWAADWLRTRVAEERVTDHVDKFFADQILGVLATDFADVSQALMTAASEEALIPRKRMLQLYRRLAWTFRAEITSFERKLYSSLSQEANKAMNLNSYIGLMGHSFHIRTTPDGQVLAPAANSDGELVIPDAEYLLTLDADSIILPEYCLRLVYVMTQPENARLAVIQTPYSAFPGSASRMERLSGATTDLQHIVHQGMSYHGATFWVGANAVIRKRALDDIVEIEHQGGFEIRRYVMDRTVIEDTESSIDLAIHGWKLLNYPERLSYSATPPDFGSLCIQRRRWANGGLIIMPKLFVLRKARLKRAESNKTIETLLRVNYLASTCWSSIALVLLLAYPFNSQLLSPLVLMAAAPYFMAMSSDLKRCGYKRLDIFRVYGFNLILLPVNLAGVVKSVQQAVTGKRIPFARTPKVANRTATPLLFAISPFIIIVFSAVTVWRDVNNQFWGNAAFAAFNALTASYALFALMGASNALVDIWLGFVERLYVTDKASKPKVAVRRRRKETFEPTKPTWEDVLYRGAPATATGEHISDGTGMFRILAEVPEPPVKYNRRASDRAGGGDGQGYRRRATDRVDGGQRAGDAGDRRGDRVNAGSRAGDRAGDRVGENAGNRASDRETGAHRNGGSAGRRVSDRPNAGNGDGGRASDRLTGAGDPIRTGDRVAGKGTTWNDDTDPKAADRVEVPVTTARDS